MHRSILDLSPLLLRPGGTVCVTTRATAGRGTEGRPVANLLQIADWTPQNPDLVVLAGSDPAAAAAIVIVTSLAPVGEPMMIQLNFRGDSNGVDITHVVAEGDTLVSVALDLATQIAAFPLCQQNNISTQWTPGTAQFGVTHHLDNLATVSAQRHAECFSIQQGAPQLDAGPILALNRLPIGGDGQPFAPPPGSNIGQITAGSCRADNPGEASTEYVAIGFNIISNDPNNLDAEFAVYTTETRNGQQTLIKRLSITKAGVFVGENGRAI
jgi:hypothetical protein